MARATRSSCSTPSGAADARWSVMAMAMAEAGRSVRGDIIVPCHGGPFGEPAQVGEALRRMPGVHGFFRGSSVERLPTGRAISQQVEAFKRLSVAG